MCGSAPWSPACSGVARWRGFSIYVRDAGARLSIHGSIAAVVVFLLWIYISAVILLYGVEVTRCLRALAASSSARDPGRPGASRLMPRSAR